VPGDWDGNDGTLLAIVQVGFVLQNCEHLSFKSALDQAPVLIGGALKSNEFAFRLRTQGIWFGGHARLA
jgi:hypothetical protein